MPTDYFEATFHKSHTIHIFNIKNDDTIFHSLILLKGKIVSNDEMAVNGNISVQTVKRSVEWPVTCGHFKVLISLTKGWNEILLKYKNSELPLKVQYQSNNSKHYVIPIYIVSFDHSGQFQSPPNKDCSVSSARERIAFAARLLQCILAEKLAEIGLNRCTFTLKEEQGCALHVSPLPVKEAQNMNQEELWKYYGRELVTKYGVQESSCYKFLAFLACTKYEGGDRKMGMTYEEILSHTKAHVALGGGGLALFGTGCLHTWPRNETEVLPSLRSIIPVDQSQLMDDSCYRGTYGGCLATTLGSVLHELCHTFDLGHTERGVMGRGFDHLNLVFGEEDDIDGDVNSNAGIHLSVDFTVNLQVKCVVQDPKEKSSPCVRPSVSRQRGGRAIPPNSTDKTFFTKSCAFILAYHKWFIGSQDVSSCDLTFDERSWTLKSSAGLRVIEIREGDRQVVRASWCFSQARLLFLVPRSTLPSSLQPPVLLIAEDSVGTILRNNLSLI